MVERRRNLRALRAAGAASLVAVLGVAWSPGSAHAEETPGTSPGSFATQAPRARVLLARAADRPGAQPARAAVRPAERDSAPLRITIDTMSPSSLPTSGDIRLSGRVTNRSDDVWSTIRLYSFMGDDLAPMRTAAELREAMTVPYDAVVGERETELGKRGEIAELQPGETATYRLRVPARAFSATAAGVYWFGVHALGLGPDGDDLVADGRARTFLPFVPRRFDTPLPAALVIPLTRPVLHAEDGSLADPEVWARAVSPGGRLDELIEFGALAEAPVTWVLDPAVVDAVAQLAAGNPARDLGPTGRGEGGPGETAAPTGGAGADDGDEIIDGVPAGDPLPDGVLTEGAEPADGLSTPGDSPTGGTGDPEPAPEPTPAQVAAQDWLQRLREALEGQQVLALPYGNVDVPAALRHAPDLLDLALAQRSETLDALGIETTPVLTSSSGYLDTDSIEAAGEDTTVILSERMFPGSAPASASVDGTRVLVDSQGVGQGSPGPSPSLSPVGLRQRVMAEAAVRLVRPTAKPLVAVLPTDWRLGEATGFFDGLDADWLDLDSLADLESAATTEVVDPATLDYPLLQARRQLDAVAFEQSTALVTAGDTLQNVLTDNNQVGGRVAEEALTALSYAARRNPIPSRVAVLGSLDWLKERLDAVHLDASTGVTLSGASGNFVVSLVNDLTEPVEVTIVTDTDDGIEITQPTPVALAPRSRTNLVLEAVATSNRVFTVDLYVADTSGAALGDSTEIAVRSAQVSQVIWLIIGTGAGILFVAITIRLVRRVRGSRDPGPAETA